MSKTEKDIKKIELINDFFSIKLTDDDFDRKIIAKKLKIFRDEYGYEQHIDDALTISKFFLMESEVNHNDEAAELIAPIVERLIAKKPWEAIDVNFASLVIANTETYRQALALVKRVFEYGISDETKLTTLFNTTLRLVKAKFKENIDIEKLTISFRNYIELGLDLCEEIEDNSLHQIYTNVFLMRKNLFEKNDEGVKIYLKALKHEKPLIKALRKEVSEIISYRGKSLSKINSNEKIGKNLRKLRKERNLTLEDVAQYLEVSVVHIGTYEKGIKNISIEHIYRLTDLLNVSMDTLFYNISDEEGEISELKSNLNSLINNFSKDEIKIIIDIVSNIKKFRENEKKDIN